ncbi:MAG: sensor histidine kinase, partial [Myxococcota bacterium]
MTKSPRRDLAGMQRRLMRLAGEGLPRYEFFSGLLAEILEISGCSTARLVLGDDERVTSWEADQTSMACLRIESLSECCDGVEERLHEGCFEDLCLSVLLGKAPENRGKTSPEGAFFDESWPISGRPLGRFVSSPVAVLPLVHTASGQKGVLGLRTLEPQPFHSADVDFLVGLAEAVAIGVAHYHAQWALRERVKELTCLYEVSRVAQRADISEEVALQHIVDVLPSGWQYPEITSAVVVLDGRTVAKAGSARGVSRLTAELTMAGVVRGSIEVVYGEDRPSFDEGPFLREERRLLELVARQVSSFLESRQIARERAKLEEQFRETERLATIGRLAAGTAHELNEPLGAILGFAQLARKQPRLPAAVERDLDSIVKASLHAREVIRELLLFSRQAPPSKLTVNVESVIKDALSLLRGRIEGQGVEVHWKPARSLPKIEADPAQMRQVFINLMVNAVQAMP